MVRALYVSYDGVLEPLCKSQVIPYLKGLSQRKVQSTLLTFEKKSYLKNGADHIVRKELESNHISWVKLGYHKNPLILSTLLDILLGFIISTLLVVKRKIQVIHVRSYVPAMIGLFIKKAYKTKFIFDMRGFWPDERIESGVWKKGLMYTLVKKLEKIFLNNADEIVVLTNRAKLIIEDWGYKDKNISVIPCCVDVDIFKADTEFRIKWRKDHKLENSFILVHTGSLEGWYLKEEMLDYFKVVKKVIPSAHFLILTHSQCDVIMDLISQKELDPTDFTIFPKDFEDMPKYLSIADMAIIFIIPTFSKIASSPTKLGEYLSCGVPVVINSGIGDTEEMVEKSKAGVIVREFNDKTYYESIERLQSLMKSGGLAARCRITAIRYLSLEEGINKYSNVYSHLAI